VAQVLVQDKGGHVLISVANLSGVKETLYRGTRVGTAKEILTVINDTVKLLSLL
jgi:hypothetical protein